MATNEERLIEAIRQMAGFSVVDDIMPEILHRIAVLANDTIEPAAMVGLTMAVHGRPATPVFTDEAAPEIDSVQYETGIGPCLDSFRDGKTYGIPSTLDDTRWKPFSESCARHGVLSTMSIPIESKDDVLGALNFYARTEHAFGDDHETLGVAFAAQAAIVITNAKAYWDARALGEQLTQALESRLVIERAKGLLMSGGITSDQAFDLLRKASQRENRKLRDIAADVIDAAERRARAN